MKCENCGAAVSITDPSQPTVECPYCHTVNATPRAAGPASLGEVFADRNGNGIPDVFDAIAADGAVGGTRSSVTTRTTTTVYEVNGQRYASLEEMPPDVRRGFAESQRMLADSERMLAGAEGTHGAAPPVFVPGAAAERAGPRAVSWRKIGIALFVAACIAAGLLLR